MVDISAFRLCNSGHITSEDLQKALQKLGKTVSSPEIDEIIKEVDTEKDGKISFDEFKRLMQEV